MSKTKVVLAGDEWKITVDELCQRYSTNVGTGLTTAQAKLNKKQYGKNEYKLEKDKNAVKKTKEQKDQEKKLREELKKDKKAKEEKKLKDDKVYGSIPILRDGVLTPLSTKKLVVGDIVELAAGQEVPADMRIIVSNGIQVDPSAITAGAAKSVGTDFTNDNPMETDNLVFLRYKIISGTGKGIVIAVGKSTVASQLSKPVVLSQ